MTAVWRSYRQAWLGYLVECLLPFHCAQCRSPVLACECPPRP